MQTGRFLCKLVGLLCGRMFAVAFFPLRLVLFFKVPLLRRNLLMQPVDNKFAKFTTNDFFFLQKLPS